MQLTTLARGLFVLALLLISPLAKANLLLYDPFDYTSGSALIGQTDTYVTPNQTWFGAGTGTVGVGPTINSSSLSLPSSSYPTFPASVGNSANVKGGNTNDSWTPRISLGTTIGSASGTVYYSLLAQLPNSPISVGNGTPGTFFAGFNNSTGSQGSTITVTGADLLIHQNGTGYSFGINNASANPTRSFDTKVFGPGDTVLLVASYTFNPGSADDVANLYVDPPDGTLTNGTTNAPIVLTPNATSTADMTTTSASNVIKSFFLRDNSFQPSSGGVNVDEVRVWTVPEPTSIALISLVTAGLMMRRRATGGKN